MEDNLGDPNMLIGEDLLRKHFSLSGPESQQVFLLPLSLLITLKKLNHTIKETLSESRSQTTMRATRLDPHSPLNRPTTPSMLNKMIRTLLIFNSNSLLTSNRTRDTIKCT